MDRPTPDEIPTGVLLDQPDYPTEKHRKRVSFSESQAAPPAPAAPLRALQIPPREQFLRDWPHAPLAQIPSPDDADPFPLYHPNTARYFDQDGLPDGKAKAQNMTSSVTDISGMDEDEEWLKYQSDSTSDKKFAYSQKGDIKDFFFMFKPQTQPEEQENMDLSGLQISDTGDFAKILRNEAVQQTVGDTDGWDEDSHSPEYWAQRNREVEHFVKNDLWSVDPIGDWSFLNRNKVPKHFLRKLRRYIEIRPMEYLRDTGSYRMFHVLNQYNDLEKLSTGPKKALREAKKMELDYLAMIWLSIWDPKLEANVWQLKEMSASDWFFSRAGWSSAIGVTELLTKNELHSMDSLWEHRMKQLEDDQEEEAEELEEWIAGDDDMDDNSFTASSTLADPVGGR